MQTLIPSPPRSPRKDLSSDKAIDQELMVLKKKVDEVLYDIVPQIASNATNDLIKDNLPSIVVDAIIEELFKIHMKNTIINVHPTTSASTATTTSDLQQQQLYLKMKTNHQAQVFDLELWDVLRSKFENYSASTGFCRDDTFRKHDHDEHQGDDGPPKGEKSSKRKIHLKVQRLQEALHQNNQSRNPKILHQNVKNNINNKNTMHGLRIQLLMKMR
ncbi:hypothetical protein Tco_1411307 [Tanacetum coccineum]